MLTLSLSMLSPCARTHVVPRVEPYIFNGAFFHLYMLISAYAPDNTLFMVNTSLSETIPCPVRKLLHSSDFATLSPGASSRIRKLGSLRDQVRRLVEELRDLIYIHSHVRRYVIAALNNGLREIGVGPYERQHLVSDVREHFVETIYSHSRWCRQDNLPEFTRPYLHQDLYDQYITSDRSETHIALQYRDRIHEATLTRLRIASELTAGGGTFYVSSSDFESLPATVLAYDLGHGATSGAQREYDLVPWWVVHRQFMSGKIEDMLGVARQRECPLPLPQLCHTVLYLSVNKRDLVATNQFTQLLEALRTLLRGYLDLITSCDCSIVVAQDHNTLLSEFARVCFRKNVYSVVRGFDPLNDLPPYNNDHLFKIAQNLRVDAYVVANTLSSLLDDKAYSTTICCSNPGGRAVLCNHMTQTCALLDEYTSQLGCTAV
jgi:hypothetical protein